MYMKYALAFGISLLLTLVVMPMLIPFLHKIKFGQSVRSEGPKSHIAKNGTPTMGGTVFVLIPVLVLLVLDYKAFASKQMLLIVLAYLGYALIGFIDDYIIVVKKNNEGLKPSIKFLFQSILAVVFYLFYQSMATTTVLIPLFNITIDIGHLYFVLVFIMFTAESNAVNFTDGLDGLCAGTSLIAIAPYIIFALLQENQDVAMLLLAV
ncbi:MAG: phospho-N-acetylmuramoyl-pentapeptide-transferase, partial [Erysipelotrichaceae bacterium]